MSINPDHIAQKLANITGQPIEGISFADPDGSNHHTVTTKPHYPEGKNMKIAENMLVEFNHGDDVLTGTVVTFDKNEAVISIPGGKECIVNKDEIIHVLKKNEPVVTVVKPSISKHRHAAIKALRSAYRALSGKPGLTEVQKVKRLLKAQERLTEAQAAVSEAIDLIPGEVLLKAQNEYAEFLSKKIVDHAHGEG